jgi:hypothetical protein
MKKVKNKIKLRSKDTAIKRPKVIPPKRGKGSIYNRKGENDEFERV